MHSSNEYLISKVQFTEGDGSTPTDGSLKMLRNAWMTQLMIGMHGHPNPKEPIVLWGNGPNIVLVLLADRVLLTWA